MKALELATVLESDTADELLCQAYCDHMIDAAAELRRLAAVESDCAPYLKEGETPAERIKRELGDAESLLNLYRDVMAERDALKAELEGRHQSIIEMGNMLTEIVNLIRGEPEEGTSHSTHDAVARVRALDEFATAAVTAVVKLKAENECLLAANRDCIAHYEDARAELERIKALEPVAWLSTDCIGERYLAFGRPLDNDPVEPLYALGSKTHE